MKLYFSFLTAVAFLLLLHPCFAGAVPRYAVAAMPTPVFHTPHIKGIFGGSNGNTLRLDACGQIREMEFVAIPGTVFRIESAVEGENPAVYRVTTDDYPYATDKGYFIDSRFVTTSGEKPAERMRRLPSGKVILDKLLAAQGSRYVWGGNFHEGIRQMTRIYPPAGNLPAETLDRWHLRGVDCSGLLYEATGGYTPRNTSALVHYGVPVPIAGLDADRIIVRVEPLDLIVWNGHVMIILDRERLIESRLDCGGKDGGVKVRSLRRALTDIMKSRIPLDDFKDAAAHGGKGFVIRRWFTEKDSAP